MEHNTPKLLLVDFDRTLFDLDLFYHTIWQTLAKHHDFDFNDAFSKMRDFYYAAHDGYHGTYSFENHVRAFIPDMGENEAIAELHSTLPETHFLYDDATEVTAWQQKGYEVRILSFGEAQIQQFKLSFCPELEAVPKDIILTPKPAFIQHHFANRQGYLIDDKTEVGLPKGIKQIHILRNKPLENNSKSDMIVVNSLKQASSYL
jgi:hypothetical protein